MLASNRLLKAVLILAALTPFHGALAQGLGELTLESSLNEPLQATIELIEVGGLNESQITVSVASADEYEQYGLPRDSVISGINFTVELFPLGRGQVILSTEERITEPFLNLLISARWPDGRVLRDYTLLIDLPALSEGSATAPVLPAEVQVADDASESDQPAANQQSYTVNNGDSLWEIAEQTRPDTDVSVQQMMIAIQRANEDAFVNNNVNRLLNGKVLRIPARREISIIEHSAAIAQINAQNEALGLMRVVGNSVMPARTTERDELSVLTEDDAEVGADSSDLVATIAALESELMLSEEDLDRVRLENIELRSQLAELEQQIEILKNIIAFEDERIAQLQSTLAEQAEATAAALSEASKAAAMLEAAEQETSAPQGLVAKLIAMLQSNLVLLGVIFFVVLLVLGILLYKVRAGRPDEDDGEFDQPREQADTVPRGASRIEEQGEDAEKGPGLLARLLSMFRRGKKDEAESESETAPAAAGTEPVSEPDEAPEQEPEEDAEEGAEEEVDFADLDSMLAEEDEEDDAEQLADSVMAEVEEAMQESDEDESELQEESQAAQDEQGQPDSEGNEAASEKESFEFSLDDAPQPDIDIPEPEQEMESFEFNLDNTAPPGTGNNKEGLDLSLGEDSDDGDRDFDLGNLSFNEDDAAEAARAVDENRDEKDNESDMDESDTKIDLAVAYEAMGDVEGAIEILEEVINEGKPVQIEEAQRLKDKWQNA